MTDPVHLDLRGTEDSVHVSLPIEAAAPIAKKVKRLVIGMGVVVVALLGFVPSLAAFGVFVVIVGILVAALLGVGLRGERRMHFVASADRVEGDTGWHADPDDLRMEWSRSKVKDGTMAVVFTRESSGKALARYAPVRATEGDLVALQSVLAHFADANRASESTGEAIAAEVMEELQRLHSS